MIKVVHLAIAHRPDDIRIFYKECRTLANQNDYEVIYLTGEIDQKINKKFDNVTVRTFKTMPGCSPLKHPLRWLRNRHINSHRLFMLAKKYNADIYHIHEYSFIHLAKKLKKFNHSRIIYDVHEDYPRQIIEEYQSHKIKHLLARIISCWIELSEIIKSKNMEAIIAATPYIGKRFSKFHKNVTVINNYAIVSNIEDQILHNEKWICYGGSMTPSRGLTQLVDAVAGTDIRLQLAGTIQDSYYDFLKNRAGWENVDYHGHLNREEIRKLYASSSIGIITHLHGKNADNGMNNKMFEYMEAGIPVIASDFPHWSRIIEEAECGICVNPSNVREISYAIQYLMKDKIRREKMGRNGRQEVEHTYNWDVEAVKLIALYEELVKNYVRQNTEYQTA